MGKKKQASGHLGDCSEEQLEILAAFRNEVKALGLTDPPYDDHYLLRFLRARKFDLNKTLLMFKNFIQWRNDIKIEDLKRFKYEELNQVKRFYPHGYFRTDREGRPIYIECAGQIKFKEMMEVTNDDRFYKYFIQCYEHLLHVKFPACSKATGKRVSSTIYIMDLKGGALKLIGGKVYDFIKAASKIGQDNYPEVLGKMFIVNAPLVFYGVWNMIKPWIDERTRNKISILGSSFKKELLEYIDEENLPDFLGGKATVDDYGEYLTKEQGPWQEYEKEINWPDGKEDKKAQEIKVEKAGYFKKKLGCHTQEEHKLQDDEIDFDTAKNYSTSDPYDRHSHIEKEDLEEILYNIPWHHDHIHNAQDIRLFHTKSMPVKAEIQ